MFVEEEYDGNPVDQIRHGQGTYTRADGKKYLRVKIDKKVKRKRSNRR